jgi:hypothetical protein
MATGLAIRDASDTPAGFLYIVPSGVIFRDKHPSIFSFIGDEQQHSTAEALPASGSMLVNHELVRSPEKDLGWHVPTQFATEGALNGDGLKRELPDARGHITAAWLAGHHEGLPISRHLEHASMIGNTLRESGEHQHTSRRRTETHVTCSGCGSNTTVPFKPTQDL